MATTGAPRKNFNPFGGMRGTKYGIIFGCVLALLLSMAVVLFVGITFCLTPILGAIVLYFVPTYFGLKSKPKLAVVGLVFLLVLGLSVGLTAASAQDGLTKQTAERHAVLQWGGHAIQGLTRNLQLHGDAQVRP